ncbi:MAG: hypothetical protein A2293_14210 [Elusimicrobia bacterium RIFOXYB2_FULL_49_7]|nr:MAG: hypothetical protein A2293_14210 [Elusimicrobia bacterium RIFOXYB2_FULL_49_7]
MLKFLLPGLLLLVILGLFIRNNLHQRVAVSYETVKSAAPSLEKKKRTETIPLPDTLSRTLPAGQRAEYVLAPIHCRTADTSGLSLLIGLRLVFEKGPLSAEMADKEDNIIRLVKFVFSDKVPAQIDIPRVRSEILGRLNAFLTSGKVVDILFTTFDIIPKAAP